MSLTRAIPQTLIRGLPDLVAPRRSAARTMISDFFTSCHPQYVLVLIVLTPGVLQRFRRCTFACCSDIVWYWSLEAVGMDATRRHILTLEHQVFSRVQPFLCGVYEGALDLYTVITIDSRSIPWCGPCHVRLDMARVDSGRYSRFTAGRGHANLENRRLGGVWASGTLGVEL